MRTGWKLFQRLLAKAVLVLSFLVAFGPVGSALGQPSGPGLGDIEIFAQQKDRAETFTRLLKKSYEKKKLSEPSLQKGESLYNEAKAAFNGYLTQYQFELKAGRQPSQKSLSEAVKKSEKFTAYADEQVYGVSRGPVAVGMLTTLIAALTKAGVDFYKEYRKVNQEQREILIQELEKLKWQAFDQIN